MERPRDTDDVPPDVRSTLERLLAAAGEAVRAGEFGTAEEAVGTAATVCRNKLPEGERRERFLHGFDAIETALSGDEEPAVALEYVSGLRERL